MAAATGGEILATSRLELRPLGNADLDAVHRHWTGAEVRRFLWDCEQISRQRAEVELRKSLDRFERRGYGLWGVRRREGERRLAGVAGLLPVPESGEVEVIFSLEPEEWGLGLATEAAAAVLDWGFDRVGLERIVGRCDAPNVASRRVLERLGMRFEKRQPIHGLDSLHYALAAEER